MNAANARASTSNGRSAHAAYKPRRRRAHAAAALIALALAAGCSDSKGGSTSCQEYASLSPNTGLFSNANEAQEAVIRKMLEDHGKSRMPANLALAETQVIAYCNIFGGQAGSNAEQPIENIPGLDS